MRHVHRIHLFACTGSKCGDEQGRLIAARLRELLPDRKEIGVRISTSSCQGLCSRGPNLTVYPEGISYHRVELGHLDRIVEEHVRGGVPVEEWIVDPLPEPDGSADS